MTQTGMDVGDRADVRANGRTHTFVIAGDLPGVAEEQSFAVIDIAGAMAVRPARTAPSCRPEARARDGPATPWLSSRRSCLPSRSSASRDRSRRTDTLSRAYRVNLDMLALMALLTGAFLVYSAQSLSVARRRASSRCSACSACSGRSPASCWRRAPSSAWSARFSAWLAAMPIAGVALRLVGGDLGGGYFNGAPRRSPSRPGRRCSSSARRRRGARRQLRARPARRAARPRSRSRTWAIRADPRSGPALSRPCPVGAGAGAPSCRRCTGFRCSAISRSGCCSPAVSPRCRWLARLLLTPLQRQLRLPASRSRSDACWARPPRPRSRSAASSRARA